MPDHDVGMSRPQGPSFVAPARDNRYSEIQASEKEIAAARVFNTTELAESIFLELPIEDLLIITRVSKHWKAIIEGSPQLQRGLFFKPLEGPPIDYVPLAEQRKLKYNINDYPFTYSTPDGTHKSVTVFANPFIHTVKRTLESMGCVKPPTDIQKAVNRPEASWRRMYAFQPPVRTVTYHYRPPFGIRILAPPQLEDRKGVRIDMLFKTPHEVYGMAYDPEEVQLAKNTENAKAVEWIESDVEENWDPDVWWGRKNPY